MTTKEILNYYSTIRNLIDSSIEINSLIKYKLLGILKQLEPFIQNYETIREELIQKYGSEDANGRIGIFVPSKDDFESDEDFKKAIEEYKTTVEKYTDEQNKILTSEVDVNIKKIGYEDMMNSGIPATYLVALYDLIEE